MDNLKNTPDNQELYELIRRAQKGDEYAFEKLLKIFQRYIYSIVRRFYLKDGDYDDLIQEAHIAFHQAVMAYENNDESIDMDSFSFICITRRLSSKIRTSNSLKNSVLTEAIENRKHLETCRDTEKSKKPEAYFSSPEDLYIFQETIDEYFKVINKSCSEMTAKIFDLRIQGYDYDTIAKELDISAKMVDNCIQSARKKLRKKFDK